uniref:Thioredoxin domain-containing protein n=1 Tax=Entomoneis paludosa TaxID=265537 RepID=A0A7S2YPM7_9STRA
MTDRRRGGLLRYTLHNPTPESMNHFINSFWQEELAPDAKTPSSSFSSSSSTYSTNKYGVRAIQGGSHHGGINSLSKLVRENRKRQQHMVVLFISPTCGHCKRLLSMMNQVSQILRQAPGWDNVGLYTLNVASQDTTASTREDVSFTVRWVPELAYISPQRTAADAVQYYGEPQTNKLAGDLNHYASLLEWLLRVLDLQDSEFVDLYQSLQEFRKNQGSNPR